MARLNQMVAAVDATVVPVPPCCDKRWCMERNHWRLAPGCKVHLERRQKMFSRVLEVHFEYG